MTDEIEIVGRKVVMKKPGDLKPYERNARVHSDAQIEQIMASIREFGFTVPILVDGDGIIIAGHGREIAAQRLGMPKVPCIVADGMTEAQRRAYVIADNKLTENGGWDDEILSAELRALMDAGIDAGLTGFDDSELSGLLKEVSQTAPESTPDSPAAPVSQTGDIWICGDHRVMCGDCTKPEDVAALLAGAQPHLMVTDPPYGVSYDPKWRAKAGVNKSVKKMGVVMNDDIADWTGAWALFPGHVCYIWHGGLHSAEVQASIERVGFRVRSQIIWSKDRMVLGRGDYHWQHEPCWYAVLDGKRGLWGGGRSQTTIWSIPSRDDDGHGHSTQKPVECMRRPMVNNSEPGDFVYDPFLGSGTSMIAAQMEARKSLGMEIHPPYVDVSVMRWQEFANGDATLEQTGETLQEVTARRGAGKTDG